MKLNIRLAVEADAHQIADIHIVSWQIYLPWTYSRQYFK